MTYVMAKNINKTLQIFHSKINIKVKNILLKNYKSLKKPVHLKHLQKN